MFSLQTLLIFIIYAAVLYVGRRVQIQLASRNSPRPGLILPAVAWIVAMVLSVHNFIIAFDVSFSLFAFLAALVLFVFFAVPAMYFSLLYVDGRKEVRARKEARSMRMRQVKTQQRVHSNLQHRYEAPIKQEPIIYMPERETRAVRTGRRPANTSRSGAERQNKNQKQNPSASRRKR